MGWRPPRTFELRYDWARQHPWLVGFYWSLSMATLGIVVALLDSHGWNGVIVNLVVWPIAGMLVGLMFYWSVRRGWGERKDADQLPLPSRRRPWRRESDRSLTWTLLLFTLVGVVLLATLVGRLAGGADRPGRILLDVVGLLGTTWLVTTTWQERRRRRSAEDISGP